ncbi:hypothetical protein QVD99_004553 [Batrachochytrium dendrobatidis]|nr:hypothetical protein O5D80_002790 [Batrachochytrium dendrobatidis]KAK5668760.1 hypothetical protein QVD99_004553 [Batrachochytrium dendrobatidis]
MMNLGVQPKSDGRNPNTVTCYICGRDFGSKSISIHEPKCMEKFEKTQAALPKSQRKPVPVRPTVGVLPSLPKKSTLAGSSQVVSNQAGNAPDIGTVQQNAMQSYNDAAYATYSEQTRSQCPNCPHKFAPDRLEVHLRSCRPGGLFSKKQPKSEKSETDCRKPVEKKQCDSRPSKQAVGSQPAGVKTNTSAYCSQCGNAFSGADRFCSSCGTKR